MKKKVLITGGAGYIGSMLATQLIYEGYFVTVIDLMKYEKNSLNHLFFYNNFKLIQNDVRNLDILKKEVIKRNRLIAENHLTLDEKPWCTIPQAMLAIDNLRENEEDVDLERLDEIDEFLQENEANFKNYL